MRSIPFSKALVLLSFIFFAHAGFTNDFALQEYSEDVYHPVDPQEPGDGKLEKVFVEKSSGVKAIKINHGEGFITNAFYVFCQQSGPGEADVTFHGPWGPYSSEDCANEQIKEQSALCDHKAAIFTW